MINLSLSSLTLENMKDEKISLNFAVLSTPSVFIFTMKFDSYKFELSTI